MEMPKPTRQHKKMEKFIGRWTGQEKMHPSPWCPEGADSTAVMRCRSELDGFFMVTDYRQKMGRKVTYRGLGFMGFDQNAKAYTMNWFDCMGGGAQPATGTWEGGKLVFQMQSPMGHHRYTYSFPKPDTCTLKMEHSQDRSDWQMLLEGRYTREA